jgi:hypothetical protein
MEAYCGIGGTVPLVLILGERLSGQLHALAVITSGKESPAFIEHKLSGFHNHFEHCGEEQVCSAGN